MPLLVNLSVKMNPGKSVTMPGSVKNTLDMMLVNGMSVDCAFISVRMGENKDY